MPASTDNLALGGEGSARKLLVLELCDKRLLADRFFGILRGVGLFDSVAMMAGGCRRTSVVRSV